MKIKHIKKTWKKNEKKKEKEKKTFDGIVRYKIFGIMGLCSASQSVKYFIVELYCDIGVTDTHTDTDIDTHHGA